MAAFAWNRCRVPRILAVRAAVVLTFRYGTIAWRVSALVAVRHDSISPGDYHTRTRSLGVHPIAAETKADRKMTAMRLKVIEISISRLLVSLLNKIIPTRIARAKFLEL